MTYFADIDGSTVKITQQGSIVFEFKSDHGEAETTMFAHGKDTATEHLIRKMIISFPDTGAAVVSCFQKICPNSIDEI